MPKYMYKVSYTQQGLAGLMSQGADARVAQIGKIVEANGGNLETFYFAFGETDAYVINDLPNDTSAAALALAVTNSGTGSVETVKLLTPGEVDEARGMQTGYVPPGA
jgi:uncharacterized protein with GYD domain